MYIGGRAVSDERVPAIHETAASAPEVEHLLQVSAGENGEPGPREEGGGRSHVHATATPKICYLY